MKYISRVSLFIAIAIYFVMGIGVDVFAQKASQTVMVIDGEKVTVGEFLTMYNKNNMNGLYEKTTIDEYLDLFINYKLKVKEAEALRYDTIESLNKELAGYREQLTKPYLIDEEVNKKILEEAYQRMKYDVKASHILVKVAPTASANDSLMAYERAMEIRNQIMQGVSFEEMAVEYSDDISAKDRVHGANIVPGNKGDLGFFTVFDMVYPFETAVYNLEVGEVSLPVRSAYGYHIIKLVEKIDAMGQVKTAHIMKFVNEAKNHDDSLKIEDDIKNIYAKIQAGEDFAQVAKQYSDDKSTSLNGGELPWFRPSRLTPEFIYAIMQIEKSDVDYSSPFLSKYGWHILRLLEKKGVGSYEESIDEIKKQITKNDRASESKVALIEKIKKEYKAREYEENIAPIIPFLGDEFLAQKWSADTVSHLNATIFKIGKEQFTQYDFAKYLEQLQPQSAIESVEMYVHFLYKRFVDETALEYENSKLEEKYAEFKNLMKEYRDGILLFEVTNDLVWRKAIVDTVGLEQYYEKNRDKYNWEERVSAKVVFLLDDSVEDQVRELLLSGLSSEELLAQLNNSENKKVTIKEGSYEKDSNDYVQDIEWKRGVSPLRTHRNQKYIVYVNEIVAPQPKTFIEAKGLVSSDYQQQLEKDWIEQLRAKYTVEINMKTFNKIKKSNS